MKIIRLIEKVNLPFFMQRTIVLSKVDANKLFVALGSAKKGDTFTLINPNQETQLVIKINQ